MNPDGQIVERPMVFPNRCALCPNEKGPQFDTMTEDINGFRQYVCNRCAGIIAVRFGLVAGEELERLTTVDHERSELAVQIDQEILRRKEAEHETEEMRRLHAQLREQVAFERQRADQLEDTLTRMRTDLTAQLEGTTPEFVEPAPGPSEAQERLRATAKPFPYDEPDPEDWPEPDPED